jgi:hypothetical protein
MLLCKFPTTLNINRETDRIVCRSSEMFLAKTSTRTSTAGLVRTSYHQIFVFCSPVSFYSDSSELVARIFSNFSAEFLNKFGHFCNTIRVLANENAHRLVSASTIYV